MFEGIIKAVTISTEEANELIGTATEHVQIADDDNALHLVQKDGVTYVVDEMTLEEAKKLKE